MRDALLRLIPVACLILAPAAAPLLAAPPPPYASATAPAQPDSQVVQTLEKLEARGKEVRTLTAKVSYRKLNTLTQDDQTRLGELAYVAANATPDQPARFAVRFNTLIVDNALRPQRRDFIFDGTWLVEKDHDRHTFEKRQVVPPGEHFNPLQIGGPFPLPLGQKTSDVLARYHVTQLPATAADAKALNLTAPPIHLHLIPRPDAPAPPAGTADHAAPRFTSIDMWFDAQSLLPVKIQTDDKQGQTTVGLRNLQVNEQTPASIAKQFDTAVPPPGTGWTVTVTPWQP